MSIVFRLAQLRNRSLRTRHFIYAAGWACLLAALTVKPIQAQQNALRPTTVKTAPTEASTEAAPVVRSIARQLGDAYTLSKSAKTVDEYSSIIETCERVLAETNKVDTIKYTHELAAWSYNRRGEAYVQLAAELFEKGEERQANELDTLALDDFTQAIGHDKTKWKALHNRGVSLGLHGKMDEAIADFDELLRLKPDHVNGWYNRGEIHAQLGQFDKAIADFSAALKLKANDHGSLIGRATAQRQLGNYSEALKDISVALKHQPSNALAYCERAEIEMSLGQWQLAAEDFRTAAKADPELGRAFRGVAWLMSTCPELKFRNAKLALEAAEKAIALDGATDYRTLDVLAATQANLGQFEDAQANLLKAIQFAPQELRAPLQSRMRLYANGEPYREPIRQAAVPGNLPR
ncbi:tetratricopeptide repeat protein [Anatilimnocola aggregata]|uniref:tetratricopeptide repeat protein n=1 Tax=Anatilimnocola aggregata TaxID=2528021 RepID=UPI00192E47AD|nr:tetratricopeptide repeat protein [Anatilimnocola aggregata]